MCGIVGELRYGRSTVAEEFDFARLIDLMARRGPDDAGYWADERCRLGFRRLAILDLSSAANQPMLAGDRYALVYNGELYNFKELRAELERLGVVFRTRGDSEVVLHALIHWGRDALARFNGMFALGFYDARRGTLLLARDHLGIKPLYVLEANEGLLFASQYDQLLAHPWSATLPVSAAALAIYFRRGYVPAPYGLLERTSMVEPGSWLEASAAGDVARGRYYTFPVHAEPDLRGDAAYEAVDAAVSAAVRRQMVSDVPLGVFLSGGIDSPLVAAKATRAQGANGAARPTAFTIGNGSGPLDEAADAAEYARRLALRHVVEHADPSHALSWLERVVEACGEPMADYSIFPTMMVSSLARREVTVMLSGDGGDELFWGYPFRMAPVLALSESFRQPQWRRNARHAARALTGDNSLRNLRWPTIGDWYLTRHTWFPDQARMEILPELQELPETWALYRYNGWRQDETAQWLRWNELYSHLDRVLLKVDRASMFHSLEVRVPLLDREVLDVAARVDWRSCLDVSADTGKLPLRWALEQETGMQTEGKRGFSVPMDEWLRGPLRPVFEDLVLGRDSLLGVPFDRAAMARMLEDHVAGRANRTLPLWTVLALALWSGRYLSRQPAGATRM